MRVLIHLFLFNFCSQAARDTQRRWSGNLDMVQDRAFDSTKNSVQYVPTLSDIPPSPMNTTQQYYSNSGATHPTQSIVTVVVQQSNGNMSEMHSDKPTEKYKESLNGRNDTSRYQSMPGAHKNMHCMQYSNTLKPSDNLQQYKKTNHEVSVTDIPRTTPQVVPAEMQTILLQRRPTTLNTTSSQSENCTMVFSNPLSGLSTTPSSTGLLPSAKSLVTLSPDTVDYVLNQEFSRADDLAREITTDTVNTFTLSSTKISAEQVVTLSPGETSLVMKPASSPNTHIFGSKSSSIEFSPRSFLKELDKDRNQLQQYPSGNGAHLQQESSKFLQNKNCSIMLSEAVAKNSDVIYVNSNVSTNTSQIFSVGQDTFLVSFLSLITDQYFFK